MKQEISFSKQDRPRVDLALNLVERLVAVIEKLVNTYNKGASRGK